jgi:hypothetical protein
MDDREFLEELERLESVPRADDSAHVRERTLEEMEEGLPLVGSDFPGLHVAEATPASLMPLDVGDPAPEPEDASDDRLPWMAGGFVMTMLLMAGAVGSALVFHQRVADILVLLR